LVDAFSLRLSPDGGSRRNWELSPYAKSLDPRFGPPGPLDAVSDASVDVWEAYADAELPPFVVAHLADLAASRRRRLPASAESAIGALLKLPGVVPAVYVADHLGRALELGAQFARQSLQPTVERALLSHAEAALADEPALGTFVRSVRPLVDRDLCTGDVIELLDRAIEVWVGDSFALGSVYELRRQLAPDEASRGSAERGHVQSLLDEAERELNGIRKLALLQDAHAVAERFAHADLASVAQAAMRAIPADAFGFERVSVEAPIPPGFVDQQVAAIVGADDLVSALRRAVSTRRTGDIDDVRARAEAGEGTAAVASIFGTTVLNAELLPKGIHAGDDLDAAIARLQDIHLSLFLPILARGLEAIQGEYDIGDPRLADQLAAAGELGLSKASKLVRCLRRYWRED